MIKKALLDLAQDDLIAVLREDMRNTITHSSGTNNPNCLYIHAYLDKNPVAQQRGRAVVNKTQEFIRAKSREFGRAAQAYCIFVQLPTD